jgi:hypothetical protein
MPCKFDGAVDDPPELVRLRNFELVGLHPGQISVELILAVAGRDPVVKPLGVGEELALVSIGGQIPCVAHDFDDLADPAHLVSHRPLSSPLIYLCSMY